MSPQERAIAAVASLSEQERQVIAWMASGLTILEVAERMRVRPMTAISYKRTAYTKLEINKATQAAVICTLAGLVTDWRAVA